MEAARWDARPARMLRSVLIAAAGAGLWMVISASAASADSGNSLLDGLSSTVSSATTSVTNTVSSVTGAVGSVTGASAPQVTAPVAPAPAPVTSTISTLTQPVTSQLTVLAPVLTPVTSAVTQLTHGVDAAVTGAVPTVGALAEPVLGGVVAPVLEGVLTPLIDDVVAPVLEPVTTVLDGVVPTVPVPGLDPDVVVVPVPGPVVPGNVPALAGTSGQPDGTGVAAASTPSESAHGLPGADDLRLKGQTAGTAPSWKTVPAGVEQWSSGGQFSGQPNPAGPDGNTPGAPPTWPAGNAAGSGNGSGSSSAASAAWLQDAFVFPSQPTSVLAVRDTQHLPPPVSFDPGSSPD